MAKAMSQVPVGTMIWVVYNEYRGGPYIYNYFRVMAACRNEIESSRAGNRQYKITYMFERVPKSVRTKSHICSKGCPSPFRLSVFVYLKQKQRLLQTNSTPRGKANEKISNYEKYRTG